MPKISIVLPNLNGAAWLEKSIESFYNQTITNFELIVIDNASSDDSIKYLRTLKGRQNFYLLENSSNTGFSVAVNMGIKKAAAPYVLLFNNDAFALPDMLEKMLLAIETSDEIFAVQSLMLSHKNPNIVDDAGDYVTIFGWAFQGHNSLPVPKNIKTKRIFSACGGAALYRKSVFDEIGLFDENFFAYLEDVDIAWRANSYGYKSILCPQAKCTHIGSATTSGEGKSKYNSFKSTQSGRNSLLYILKNMPILMLIINLPFVLPGYLTKILVFYLRGYGKFFKNGMFEAFKILNRQKKPKFYFKNILHYFWVEGSLIASAFKFVLWRIRRVFVRNSSEN